MMLHSARAAPDAPRPRTKTSRLDSYHISPARNQWLLALRDTPSSKSYRHCRYEALHARPSLLDGIEKLGDGPVDCGLVATPEWIVNQISADRRSGGLRIRVQSEVNLFKAENEVANLHVPKNLYLNILATKAQRFDDRTPGSFVDLPQAFHIG